MDFTQAMQQPGFGLGQQLVQPGALPGGMGGQMAGTPGGAPTGFLQQLMAGGVDQEKLKQLMQLQAMLQQNQAGSMAPMQQMMNQQAMSGRPAGQTQAQLGYLDAGGGFGRRV